jgi:monovalent cation/hydrogen antiporter
VNVTELLVVLLLAVVTLGVVARRLGIPYPVLFVLGGLALGFVPGLPPIRLAPNLIFLVFLSPLVLAGGWRSSIRDLCANLRPILLLAVGLILVTGVSDSQTHMQPPGVR